MAEYNINQIELPNGDICNVKDPTKLEKDFSNYTVASTPYDANALIPMYADGVNYFTDIGTLSSSLGGSGGTQQTSLVNYAKNCGTISSLPVTISDSNITSDMVVLEYTLGTPTAMTSDWTITTADGSITISGEINGSTTLIVILGVGVSTAPDISVNLASNSTDDLLKTAPRPGVYGILGVANGGTGANSAAKARANLDVYSKSEVTNAISQSTAKLTNLQVVNSFNADTLDIDIGFTPTNTKSANAILFNGNQGTVASLRLDLSPSVTVSSGNVTYTITRSGSVYTITPSTTLWGVTTILCGNN